MAKQGLNGDFTLDKALPSSVEAERLILGVILLDNMTINQAAERLKPEDFFLVSNRRIYDKMIALYERGQAIDPLTLQEELRRAGELEQVGGPAYIAALFDGVPRFSNIDNYVKLVKGKAMLRRLITSSNQIMAMAFDDEDEPEEILDKAERLIFSIAEDRIKQGFVHIGEVASRQLTIIEEIAGHQQLITGIATGFADLDYMTSGLQRGDLIIIAARPSMGKCVAADSEIVLADGSIATIEEIYQRREATLLTLGDDFKFSLTQPSAFVDDGIRPVYRVTTRLGRYVDSTLSHPYLTIDGWRKLAELKVGDRIAVPRRIGIFGDQQLRESEIESLVSDSRNGFIPRVVFQLSKSQLAHYLGSLFALCVRVSLAHERIAEISYSTVSERQARQVQHLLLRFGVVARLSEGCLEITDAHSIQALVCEIGLCGKEENVAAMYRRLYSLRWTWWSDTLLSRGPASRVFRRLYSLRYISESSDVECDIYWDEIVSIEYLGSKQVYDLTIPETHNFVANDICVHNTALSLNIAQNAATHTQRHGEKATVGIFSLEMSNEQLVNRMLCSQARVDAHRLRSGHLGKEEWRRLALAVGELAETQIYLDDTPGISVLEVRAKARRLKNERKALDLLIIDYLQLMSGRGRSESRQQEVSQISRELKMLAKELNVPLVALSQLSRAPETRTGSHKPQLSDLRESGCLAGESMVTLADSGAQVPIRDLVGKSGFKVWALNEANFRIEPAVVSRAFATGVKPVFRLTTRLGRTIRATANHKFRTFAGWKRLDELGVGDHLALPRVVENPATHSLSNDELALLGHLIGDGCTLPSHAIQYTTREKDLAEIVADVALRVFGSEVKPRIKQERTWYQVYLSSTRHHTHNVHSAVVEWLTDLGIWGLRSYEKHVPPKVFKQPAAAIGVFLRHLWATDGCIKDHGALHYPSIYYASSSVDLASGVQSLLLRLGINATLSRHSQYGKGRDQYHVVVSGKPDLEKFIECIGTVGTSKTAHLSSIAEALCGRPAKTNRDVLPREIWSTIVLPAMQELNMTAKQIRAAFDGVTPFRSIRHQNMSRNRALRVAQATGLEILTHLAQSDVYWDEIVSLEPEGEAEVYDLTVEKAHNFVANDILVHNSIEQDSDVVMFIYREEVYKPETEKQNIAEIIVGKQRNGPTGSVELVFLKQLTRFEDKYKEHM